jgi:hypothetical protein
MVKIIDMVRELNAICEKRGIHKDIMDKFAERKRLVLTPVYRTDDAYDLTQQTDKTIETLYNVFIASPSMSFNLQWRYANFLRWHDKKHADIEVEYPQKGKTKLHKIDVAAFDSKDHPKDIACAECKGKTTDEKVIHELHGDVKDLAHGIWEKAIKKVMLVLGRDSVLDRAGENYLRKYPLRLEITRKALESTKKDYVIFYKIETREVRKKGYRTIPIEVYREIENGNFKRILVSK